MEKVSVEIEELSILEKDVGVVYRVVWIISSNLVDHAISSVVFKVKLKITSIVTDWREKEVLIGVAIWRFQLPMFYFLVISEVDCRDIKEVQIKIVVIALWID